MRTSLLPYALLFILILEPGFSVSTDDFSGVLYSGMDRGIHAKGTAPPREEWMLILNHEKNPVGYCHSVFQKKCLNGFNFIQVINESFIRTKGKYRSYEEYAIRRTALLKENGGGFIAFRVERPSSRAKILEGVIREKTLFLKITQSSQVYHKEIPLKGNLYLLDLLNLPKSEIRSGNKVEVQIFNEELLSLDTLQILFLESPPIPEEKGGAGKKVMKAELILRKQKNIVYLNAEGEMISGKDLVKNIEVVSSDKNNIFQSKLQKYVIPDFFFADKLRIRSPDKLKSLVLKISPKSPEEYLPIVEDERQKVLSRDPVSKQIILHIKRQAEDLSHEVSGYGVPTNENRPILETESAKTFQFLNTVVNKIKKEKPLKLGELLVKWVFLYISDKEYRQYMSVEEIIRSRQGDCKAHAMLYTVLARLSGLPVRYCVGLVYDSKYREFTGHIWVKIYTGRTWVAMDPAFNQTRIDPTHIQFMEGSEERVLLFDFFNTLYHLRDSHFEILETTS
ncbi:MAG: transglutaminase domain-containing protein [Candidatus Aureabacteria bacterium]|nr:transglutaminase domain-containing protein [Candidatus Auribacterota bacterium]